VQETTTRPISPAEGNSWMARAHTAVIMGWVVAATLLMGIVAIAISLFFSSARAVHWIARIWGRSFLAISGIRVTVTGAERLDPRQAFIFMANHQSNFDIPVLLAHLPVPFRWLAKAELFRIPVFGRAMRGAGYISIDRANRHAAIQSLARAVQTIRQGVSMMIFPEGTRSLDGSLQPFKKGGFIMAIEAQVPVVPVVLRGTYQIMPKNRLLIRPRRVVMAIDEPIATAAGGRMVAKETLMDTVRQAIQRGLAGF
jgi:1-acyl-sn-glycerol-3-phosphate acyltransferase